MPNSVYMCIRVSTTDPAVSSYTPARMYICVYTCVCTCVYTKGTRSIANCSEICGGLLVDYWWNVVDYWWNVVECGGLLVTA